MTLNKLFSLGMLALAVGASGSAGAKAADYSLLRNFNNKNMCLDIAAGSTADNAPAILFPCHGGGNQRFRMELTLNNGKDYRIRIKHSGKCLSQPFLAAGGGMFIVQRTCASNPFFDSNTFRVRRQGPANPVVPNAGEVPFFNLVRVSDGKCIGVSGGAPVSGAPIGLFPCDGRGNQLWRNEAGSLAFVTND